MILSFPSTGLAQENKSSFDEVTVVVEIQGAGSFATDALYSPDEKLYLNIEDVFRNLEIPCIVGQKGDSLGGFLETEKRTYAVFYSTREIHIVKEVYKLGNGLEKSMGSLYLESSLYGSIFKIGMVFNFRNLIVALKPEFELPIIKRIRQQTLRSNIQPGIGEAAADTTIKRQYHVLKFGNVDWAVNLGVTVGKLTDNRLGLGLGAEILGGEAIFNLNFSTISYFNERQQQYLWRLVNNENRVFKQIQVGKISTQTISSLFSPVVGFVVTNAPTTIRRSAGVYTIQDYTQPNWLVELYINNQLINFTRADASGFFLFRIPLVYGTSQVNLRFYGPRGEERSKERTLVMPNILLPKGVFEYRLSGGILQDSLQKNIGGGKYGRAEANLGASRTLSLGGGLEYLSTYANASPIPFASASFLPYKDLTLNAEYDYGVRNKLGINYSFLMNSNLLLEYTTYVPGQKAIIFNYKEEKKADLSIPIPLKIIQGYAKFGFKQNVYSDFQFNSASLQLSLFYKNFDANIATFANWINAQTPYANGNIALAWHLKKGLTFRQTSQFSVNNGQFINSKTEVEKRFKLKGYFSLSYEFSPQSGYRSLNMTLSWDLPFSQNTSTSHIGSQDVSTSLSSRGSLAMGSGLGMILPSELSNVGRSGITLIPFVDVNHNGKFDKGEHYAYGLDVNANGGKVLYNDKDSLVRISGLEPYVYYSLEVNDKSFDNLSWRLKQKSYKVLLDPNQFKKIEIPVYPMGEVIGKISLNDSNRVKGQGRITVKFYNLSGKEIAKALSESDGYINYLGFDPGSYYAKVDPIQLERLGMIAEPAQISFTMKVLEEGDVFDKMNFILKKTEVPDTGLINKSGADSALIKPIDTLLIKGKKEPAGPKINEIKDSIPGNKTKAVEEKAEGQKPIETPKETPKESKKENLQESVFEGQTKPDEQKTVGTITDTLKKDSLRLSRKMADSVNWGNVKPEAGKYYVQAGVYNKALFAQKMAKGMANLVPYPMGVIYENESYKIRFGYFHTSKESTKCQELLLAQGIESLVGIKQESLVQTKELKAVDVKPAATAKENEAAVKGKNEIGAAGLNVAATMIKDSVHLSPKKMDSVYSGKVNPSSGRYFVQSGAYNKPGYAEVQVGKIIATQLSYPIGVVLDSGVYRVRLGYFQKASESAKCQQELLDKGIESVRGVRNY